ncbi:hypothetical protein [Phenylobacterium sp.]|uniref:hypothetical protein n=1 Tax=Phenylobacterium sp. TaxID=1871053 RepID=UPI002F949E3F
MSIYTFHSRRRDGSPVSMDAQAFDDDDTALAWSAKVVAAHPSCDLVEVYHDDRLVGVTRRETV